ncbi:hypothetical protein CK203_117541 [Vitis vinifera]|uniref:Uncharacterized protein n=1 Tax=Vitis vinifera TaxID=29760 RepID=A0A438CP32_VITVI|nr:hypothetical protein CK203_117541 [Vitis vinifera]
MFEAIEYLASSKKLEDGFGMDNVAVVNGRGKMTSNPRLRRVLWNPWQSNGRLRNMNNRSFEVLCHKQIRNARRGSKEKSPRSILDDSHELQPLQADHSKLKEFLHGCEISLELRKCCPFAVKISQPF